MRTLFASLFVLVLLAGTASAAGEVSFSAKPTAVKDGEKVKISFAIAAPTDVEVCILDAQGKEVRHLAAGVLGGKNPPPAPLAAGLAQELTWDGKDDFGKPATGGPLSIRVRAGTGVKFGGLVGGDPYLFGLISSMVTDQQGNLYVMGFRNEDFLGSTTLRQFSPEGKYLRTIMPFPADLAPGAMKDVAPWDDQAKCFRPENYANLNVQFYAEAGRGGESLSVLAASTEAGILLTDGWNLYKLDSRGAVPGPKFAVRTLWPTKNRFRSFGPFFSALSPDGKYLYISGPYTVNGSLATPAHGYGFDPAAPPGRVHRLKLDGNGPAEPFVDIPVAGKEGVGGEWTKDDGDHVEYGISGSLKGPIHGIAVDSKGQVYVADREHGRVVVFDPDGKQLGHVEVRWPDSLTVNPATGAVYVLDKKFLGRGKGFAVKLLKFDSVKDGAQPAAEIDIPNCSDLVVMAGTFAGGRSRIWLRTGISRYGKYSLACLEDKGKAFEPAANEYKPTVDGQWGWNRLAVDYNRDEVYGLDGTVGLWRYDGLTGKGEMLKKDGKPFYSQDMAVGYDGLLYVRQGRGYPEFQDYSGPFARFTRDLAPAPFPGIASNVLHKEIYSREGPGYAEKGLGVGPDGKSYISYMHNWVKYWVLGFGPDGKVLDGKYLEVTDSKGVHGKATIGPITGSNGGLRVDLAGNIYSGMWIWPKDAAVPAQWAKNEAYLASTGSVFKFTPDGGFVTSSKADWASDPIVYPGAPQRTAETKGIEARSGKGGGGFYDAFVAGAIAAFPGYGPFGHQGFGGNSCCTCRTPRFDLDRYGRLYLPNAITNSVRIVDNAGNEIVEFGKYGNFDSGYVNANTEQGKAGKPTVAAPDIPLAWPTATGVSEKHIYVSDFYNRRAVRVDYTCKTEETCQVK